MSIDLRIKEKGVGWCGVGVGYCSVVQIRYDIFTCWLHENVRFQQKKTFLRLKEAFGHAEGENCWK